MEMMIITGTLGKDAETRQAGDNNVTSFSVAVNSGYGDRKTTRWYRCNLWGKRGDSLCQHLTKGTKVAISGEFSTREYEGKTQLEIRVNEVDLMGGGNRDQSNPALGNGGGQASRGRQEQQAAFTVADLDDDVPFISMKGDW